MSSIRNNRLTGFFLLLLAVAAASYMLAGDWQAGGQERLGLGGGSGMTGVVVMEQGGIQVIDGVNQALSPVLLQKELGFDIPFLLKKKNWLVDVAITPNVSKALITSPYSRQVYFVSLLNPRNPVLLGATSAGWYPEDIAITGDGKWALVTSGGMRDHESQLFVVNIATRRIVASLQMRGARIVAVAVAPDGKTVLCADNWSGQVLVIRMNPATGALTFVKGIPIGDFCSPVNIAISPNGRTALTANAEMETPEAAKREGGDEVDTPRPEADVSVFRIDGPGQVFFTGNISLGAGGKSVQAVAFSRAGTRAFCIASRYEDFFKSAEKVDDFEPYAGLEVDVLSISGPGQAAANGITIPLPWSEYSRLFTGMDTLAVDPVDNYLYVTVQNDYYSNKIDLSPYVAVISLRTYQVIDVIDAPPLPYTKAYRYYIPGGIAFRENYRPLSQLYR